MKVLCFIFLCAMSVLSFPVRADIWCDLIYTFRARISVDVPEEGMYRLSLDQQEITEWMNVGANFRFNANYFDHNGVKLVELDENGYETCRVADGFFAYTTGPELVVNGNFEQVKDGRAVGWTYGHPGFLLKQESNDNRYMEVEEGRDRHGCIQMIDVKPHTWYRYSHRMRGAAAAGPYFYYEHTKSYQPPNRSYFDPHTQQTGDWYERSFFFYTGDMSKWRGNLRLGMELFPGAVDNFSLRKADVAFVLHADRGGARKYNLYVAPMEGMTPSPPDKELPELPAKELAVSLDGKPEWLDHGVVSTLVSTNNYTVWQAATVRKVFENTPPPIQKQDKIRLAAARNEAEAFQLVFRPRSEGELRAVRAVLTGPSGYCLNQDCFDIRQARYTTIHKPSPASRTFDLSARADFTGRIPDPLPAFAPVSYKPDAPNILVWIDVSVPKDAPAGIYGGTVTLETSGGNIELPIELEVWNFTLPDVMSCQGSSMFALYASQFLFPFHKVETKEDKYALSRAYIAELARYRFPQAYPHEAGVHYPGRNYIAGRMTIEEQIENIERELEWAFEKLHVNTVRVGHFAGHLKHVREDPARMEEDAERFEVIGQMLARRGWIDRCFILIDEPSTGDYPRVREWIAALREKPHASQIRVAVCTYLGTAYDGFQDSADIIIQINNDAHSVVSSEQMAARAADRREGWLYWTSTSHVWIDGPGINHRLWAPKVWALGGRGILQWSICQWWPFRNHHMENPWENPMTSWGNGTLAFFYPPSPLGQDLPERDMTIVPSLRLLLTREGIEDFEYAIILERLIKEAQAAGRDTAEAEVALATMKHQFETPKTTSWRLGEAHWLNARQKVAEAIINLK